METGQGPVAFNPGIPLAGYWQPLAQIRAECYNTVMNDRLTAAVADALHRAGLLRPGAHLLLALSGGPDSVALLYTLCALRGPQGLRISAAHVEHGLRGEASLADANYCEQLCRALDVPYTCAHAALSGGMDSPGAEARARDARYALLCAQARAHGADALLTAHHQDDQAQTVLMHLIRGSGARGLGGMRATGMRDGVLLLRPLLNIPHAMLLRTVDGIPVRTDESNLSPCCQRNRLRQTVLPLLTQENPHAAAHLAQCAALAALDEDCLSAQGEALLRTALVDFAPTLCVRRAPLAAAPPAVAARALRSLHRSAVDAVRGGSAPAGDTALSAADTLALVALLHTPDGCHNLPPALRAETTARYLHLLRMADGSPLSPPPRTESVALGSDLPACGRAFTFAGLCFTLTAADPAQPPPDGLRAVEVPLTALASLRLRLPALGDRIRPFGAHGGKPLRRYLTDRKLDRPFRQWLPLLCMGGEVFWAVGLGAAEGTRRTDAPAARLTVEGLLPWADGPA